MVDEAHRLHQYKNISYMGSFKKNCEKLGLTTEADELDWIIKQSDCTILFYDAMQVVGPSGIDYQRFDQKMQTSLEKRMTSYFTLLTQMRVQGGNAYIDFVKSIFEESCTGKYKSDKYDLKIYLDFSKFEKDMYRKETEVGLSRMVAGYAWPWISKKDQTKKDIEIQGIKRKWNHCTEGWVHTSEAIDEVGCIHSIQGYDLNYAFVILGKDIGYDKNTKQSISHKIYPELACIDPEYLSAAPESVIKNTAVDALGHMIESYFNSKATDFSRMLCQYGISVWAENISVLLGDEADYEAYDSLMLASCLAGMAITHTGTSIPHGLSYYLTYNKDIPHGKAVGLFLPGYLKVIQKEMPDEVSEVLAMLGFDEIEQCAAAVAGVDGRICLDVGRCLFCGNSAGNEGIAVIGIRRGKGTVCGADNAGCNGLTIAEGVADGNNLFTDL